MCFVLRTETTTKGFLAEAQRRRGTTVPTTTRVIASEEQPALSEVERERGNLTAKT